MCEGFVFFASETNCLPDSMYNLPLCHCMLQSLLPHRTQYRINARTHLHASSYSLVALQIDKGIVDIGCSFSCLMLAPSSPFRNVAGTLEQLNRGGLFSEFLLFFCVHFPGGRKYRKVILSFRPMLLCLHIDFDSTTGIVGFFFQKLLCGLLDATLQNGFLLKAVGFMTVNCRVRC
jgi:hypothetical protein